MKHLVRVFGAVSVAVLASGCTRHAVEVKPIRVEPIHIQMDVNIKLQRELEEMFAFEDELQESKPATRPKKDGT